LKAARTAVVVLLLAGIVVVAGLAVHGAVQQAERDAAALKPSGALATLKRLGPALGVIAFAAANDSNLVALARRQLPDWIENFKPLGAGKLANVVGATLVGGGLLHGDRRAVIGGLTLLEGNVLVGVAVDGTKAAFGRVRPNHPGPGRWFAGGDSFPSSHTAHAFLMASVLSATFGDPASQRAFCSLASAVALQRLHEGVHYPTDVIAGGALGWWIGHRLSVSHGLTTARP
jgi:membrane-associated phospholipid phosphatase